MSDLTADLILSIILAGALVLVVWLRVELHVARTRRRVDGNEYPMVDAGRRWLGD